MRPGKQTHYIQRIVGILLCLSVTLYALLSNYVICFDPSTQHSEIELAQHASSQHHVLATQPSGQYLEAKLNATDLALGCIDVVFQNIVGFSSKLEVKQVASQVSLPTLLHHKNVSQTRQHFHSVDIKDRRLVHDLYAYRDLKNLRTINIRR